MNWGPFNSKYHLKLIVTKVEYVNAFLKTIEPFRLRQYQITANGEKVALWYEVKD